MLVSQYTYSLLLITSKNRRVDFSEEWIGNSEEVKIANLRQKIGDFWWGRTDSLRCGEAMAVASVHRTLAKSLLSNPLSIQKVQHQMVLDFLWWGRTDSNHRSDTQQIYSLSPLATRELPHMEFVFCLNGAGRRTRTPDLLITNQLLYQLSYTGGSNRTRLL